MADPPGAVRSQRRSPSQPRSTRAVVAQASSAPVSRRVAGPLGGTAGCTATASCPAGAAAGGPSGHRAAVRLLPRRRRPASALGTRGADRRHRAPRWARRVQPPGGPRPGHRAGRLWLRRTRSGDRAALRSGRGGAAASGGAVCGPARARAVAAAPGRERAGRTTSTTASRPCSVQEVRRAPLAAAVAAAAAHASGSPRAAAPAAEIAARSAAETARCRSARAPPTRTAATAAAQISRESTSTQRVPEPRSAPGPAGARTGVTAGPPRAGRWRATRR